MSDATPVSTERRGYGRGLILGLTMAETMLLLVFCLLLAVGAMLAKERDKIKLAAQAATEAQQQLAKAKDENKNLLSQIKSLKPRTDKPLTDEEWNELVVAKATVDAIERAGLTPEEVKKLAPETAVLRDRKMTSKQVEGAAATEEKLRELGLDVSDLESLAPSIEVLRRNASVDAAKLETLFSEAEGNSTPHSWPPIINLSEANQYTFKTGSAELSASFEASLRGLENQIARMARDYNVDVIEVIGHTDERAMSGTSNIDKDLRAVLAGTKPIGTLHPADNAGLGLARALAVAKVLKGLPELKDLTVLPMSGAQLILPDDKLTDGAQTGDVKERRRIEIRVRKRNQATQPEISSN